MKQKEKKSVKNSLPHTNAILFELKKLKGYLNNCVPLFTAEQHTGSFADSEKLFPGVSFLKVKGNQKGSCEGIF